VAVLPAVRTVDHREPDKKNVKMHVRGRLNILQLKSAFWGTLAIILIAFAVMALPYGLAEAYGPQAKNLPLFVHVGLAVFSASLLIWWLARHRQTRHDIETLREEIERDTRAKSERIDVDANESKDKEDEILFQVWARTNSNSSRSLLLPCGCTVIAI
jgi:hypothetical protein